MKTLHHLVSNGEGWRLSLSQSMPDTGPVEGRNPVVIVPGYGMNSFIFGFHPNGPSLEGYLVGAGFEVWRLDMRAQGRSVCEGSRSPYSLADLALTDLGVAIDTIADRTHTRRDRVDVIGASLGASLMFAHAVLNPRHHFGSMVSMGGPVRWVDVHPALRLLFSSPTAVGLVPAWGTRRMAEVALPLLVRHAPWALSIYMNPAVTDTRAAREMCQTVEDPSRHINREIAHWIRKRDLWLRGQNIAESLHRITQPLLCVLANGDGIVPRSTAMYPFHRVGSPSRVLLEVGDPRAAMSHADLFIANCAPERVFRPLARWLARHGDPAAVPEPVSA